MFRNASTHLRTGLLILTLFSVLPMLRADNTKEISNLLSRAQEQAGALKTTASDLQSFTRLGVRWDLRPETHIAKLTEMKEQLNGLLETIRKLDDLRSSASVEQQEAIRRIQPPIRELTANVRATLMHLNENHQQLYTCVQTDPAYAELLNLNATLAVRLADVIGAAAD